MKTWFYLSDSKFILQYLLIDLFIKNEQLHIITYKTFHQYNKTISCCLNLKPFEFTVYETWTYIGYRCELASLQMIQYRICTTGINNVNNNANVAGTHILWFFLYLLMNGRIIKTQVYGLCNDFSLAICNENITYLDDLVSRFDLLWLFIRNH